MSRAYKRRKKNREIGDLTYPVGGARISRNAYKGMLKRQREINPELRNVKEDYGAFVETGNKIASGEEH
jgi:hypothetical protein